MDHEVKINEMMNFIAENINKYGSMKKDKTETTLNAKELVDKIRQKIKIAELAVAAIQMLIDSKKVISALGGEIEDLKAQIDDSVITTIQMMSKK